eukprot:m.806496 g.806496  ORF g.806496 m.806496 type:complete len:83 (+) comp59296_c0_seq17:87-335(+)
MLLDVLDLTAISTGLSDTLAKVCEVRTLRAVTITECDLRDPADIITALATLKSLQFLDMSRICPSVFLSRLLTRCQNRSPTA